MCHSRPQGKIVSVIGPNGAGKTTIFNMLTGFYLPDRGSIRLDGMEMVGKKSYEFISCGIARTFQNIRLYTQMSVLENVLIGYQCRMQQSLWDGLFNTPQKRRTEAQALEKARAPWRESTCYNMRTRGVLTCPMASRRFWKSPGR